MAHKTLEYMFDRRQILTDDFVCTLFTWQNVIVNDVINQLKCQFDHISSSINGKFWKAPAIMLLLLASLQHQRFISCRTACLTCELELRFLLL
jgi:hypothetical protein